MAMMDRRLLSTVHRYNNLYCNTKEDAAISIRCILLRTIFRAIRREVRLLLAQFATQGLQQRERTVECLLDRNIATCGNLCDAFGEFRLESIQTLQ